MGRMILQVESLLRLGDTPSWPSRRILNSQESRFWITSGFVLAKQCGSYLVVLESK
jgi:hypothetical protein